MTVKEHCEKQCVVAFRTSYLQRPRNYARAELRHTHYLARDWIS